MILSYVNFIINNIDTMRPIVVDFRKSVDNFKKLPYKVNNNVTVHVVKFCKSNGGCKDGNLLMKWETGKNNNTLPNGFNDTKVVGVIMEGIHLNNNINIRMFKNGKISIKLGLSKSIQFNTNKDINEYITKISKDILSIIDMRFKQVDISNMVASGIKLFEKPEYRIKNLYDFCKKLTPYLSKYKYTVETRSESNKKQLEKYQLRSYENAPTIGIFKTGTCDMMNITSLSEALEIERIMKRAFREINPLLFKKGGNVSALNIKLFG